MKFSRVNAIKANLNSIIFNAVAVTIPKWWTFKHELNAKLALLKVGP
jgi:hypothetical protein